MVYISQYVSLALSPKGAIVLRVLIQWYFLLRRSERTVLSVKKVLTSSLKPWWQSFEKCSCKQFCLISKSPKEFPSLFLWLLHLNLKSINYFSCILFPTYILGQEVYKAFVIASNMTIFIHWFTCIKLISNCCTYRNLFCLLLSKGKSLA